MTGQLVHLGDLPAWLQLGESTATALWAAISQHQKQQALDFVAIVRSVSRLSDEQLSELIDADPRLSELVDRAWYAASVSADKGKRRLLAGVVARAVAGHLDDAEIDEAPYLARAIGALDPMHIEMLGLIARPTAEVGWKRDELVTVAPRYGDLLIPTLMALSREGLVENRGSSTYDAVEAWKLTRFGRRLISYLPDGGFEVPALMEACVIGTWISAPLHVTVTNVGLGVARRVVLHGLENHQVSLHEPVDLRYDDSHQVELIASDLGGVAGAGRSRVWVTWEDGRGRCERDLEAVAGVWSYLPEE